MSKNPGDSNCLRDLNICVNLSLFSIHFRQCRPEILVSLVHWLVFFNWHWTLASAIFDRDCRNPKFQYKIITASVES